MRRCWLKCDGGKEYGHGDGTSMRQSWRIVGVIESISGFTISCFFYCGLYLVDLRTFFCFLHHDIKIDKTTLQLYHVDTHTTIPPYTYVLV